MKSVAFIIFAKKNTKEAEAEKCKKKNKNKFILFLLCKITTLKVFIQAYIIKTFLKTIFNFKKTNKAKFFAKITPFFLPQI